MSAPSSARPIVTATDLRRVYGEGEAAVHALRGVTVQFPAGQFAAIMGPSGSGKSTLMHLLAGLDKPSGGSVTIDGEEIGGLGDKALTNLRRDRLGFVFQAFNLVPVLTAEENILLPLTLAGRKVRPRVVRPADRQRRPARPPHRTARPSSPAASSSASPWRARSCTGPRSCSPTSRPATWTRTPPRRCWACSGDAVDDLDQTVIMVTHDAQAASVADRIVVLRDGEIVHDGGGESTEGVLDLMKAVA